MLQSTLKSRIALVFGALIACSRPAATQYYQGTLSPAAQQTLGAILTGMPRYEQGLVINAVRALGPQRAELALSQWRAAPPSQRGVVGQLVTQILQRLPQQYHQTFMNGMFGVSPQDEQFVAFVARIIAQQVTNDVATAGRIRAGGRRIADMQFGTLQQRLDDIMQEAEGMGGALGATTTYLDPNTGRLMEGRTAPVGSTAYACPGYRDPVYATWQPVGCVVAPIH